MSAFQAFVYDMENVAFVFKRNRFHHSSAIRSPISRINIHVFRPNAFWAMIRVSIPYHRYTTFFTDEILFCFSEFFRVHIKSMSEHRDSNPESFAPKANMLAVTPCSDNIAYILSEKRRGASLFVFMLSLVQHTILTRHQQQIRNIE